MSEHCFPLLEYCGDRLIVDHAWANAREKLILVEIRGKYFEIELDVAKTRNPPWPRLNQCDLMPTDRGPTGKDWPLGQEGVPFPFRFILRSETEKLKSSSVLYGPPDL